MEQVDGRALAKELVQKAVTHLRNRANRIGEMREEYYKNGQSIKAQACLHEQLAAIDALYALGEAALFSGIETDYMDEVMKEYEDGKHIRIDN